MTEELRVDSSFGNRTAVDGEILFALTWRVVVDDAGDNLLTHAALANDEHAQIRRRHLQSHVKDMVQCIAVAHDVISLFDAL